MLILSRKLRETVVIDGRITVTVIKTGNGSIRLGFEAPDDVTIYRGELFRQIVDDDATLPFGTECLQN